MSIEVLIGLFVVGGLTLYLLFGGADFGAGIWELLLTRNASQDHRDLINRAIGPIWETNHVWLIFVVVIVHSAFPAAYAALFQSLWLPLLLALAGIVLRGSTFALRYYSQGTERQEALWSAVFVGASALAPFFIGASLGAVAGGGLEISPVGHFTGSYFLSWVSPLSLYIGVFTVGLCAYLAAVYLARDASRESTPEIVEAWRRRSMVTGLFMGVLAMIGLAVIAVESPILRQGFLDYAWPLVFLSLIFGWASLWAIWSKRYALAVIGAGGTVGSLVWGWAVAQFPWIIPPEITIQNTKAEDHVLWVIFWCLTIGGLILLPSLGWLFYLFKGNTQTR